MSSQKENQIVLASQSTDTGSNNTLVAEMTPKQTSHSRTLRKKIGAYSYNVNKMVGSGFSSCVYKGYLIQNKQQLCAVKVIKLDLLTKATRLLLQNEISIIQQLNHPNVIKFYDYYYTKNHCYIITQFCQGRNLQELIDSKIQYNWKSIMQQISKGCFYLSENNILHRDIKPANIFLKGNTWKIGDFGFALKLENYSEYFKEKYTIGSPLYMPKQTLERNKYSLKNDSYALGVMMYYLISGQYPWYASNKKLLLEEIRSKDFSQQKIQDQSQQIKSLIRSLVAKNAKQRKLILQCNFDCLNVCNNSIFKGLIQLKQQNKEQVLICQFVHYYSENLQNLEPEKQILLDLLRRFLWALTYEFKWQDNKALLILRNSYRKIEQPFEFGQKQAQQLLKELKQSIDNLHNYSEILAELMLQKTLCIYLLLSSIMNQNKESLEICMNNLELHTNYRCLKPNHEKIQQYLQLTNI